MTAVQPALSPPESLFSALGGQQAVQELVERLYTRLLDDSRVARYFRDVDMPRLKRHQVLLLSQLLGGPAQYDGRDLAAAHAGLGITVIDYDTVSGHLIAALAELEAPDDVAATMSAVLKALQDHVVSATVDQPGRGRQTDAGVRLPHA